MPRALPLSQIGVSQYYAMSLTVTKDEKTESASSGSDNKYYIPPEADGPAHTRYTPQIVQAADVESKIERVHDTAHNRNTVGGWIDAAWTFKTKKAKDKTKGMSTKAKHKKWK